MLTWIKSEGFLCSVGFSRDVSESVECVKHCDSHVTVDLEEVKVWIITFSDFHDFLTFTNICRGVAQVVLERALVVTLSQAVLLLKLTTIAAREKQLLKRELATELVRHWNNCHLNTYSVCHDQISGMWSLRTQLWPTWLATWGAFQGHQPLRWRVLWVRAAAKIRWLQQATLVLFDWCRPSCSKFSLSWLYCICQEKCSFVFKLKIFILLCIMAFQTSASNFKTNF